MALKPAGVKAACAAAAMAYAAFVCSAWQITAFAGNTNIVVDNQTGNDSLEIEVSVDGTPCMISVDTGFRYNLDVGSANAKVDARVSGDVYGYYDLSYEAEADLSDVRVIRITVQYSSLYGDKGMEYDPDLEGEAESYTWDPESYDNGLPDTGMEKLDLSSGATETGTLLVQCQPVNAFDEVVLTLVDEGYKTYTIPLHMEPYFFRAEVKLPAGKYRESGTPKVTFNEYASRDSSLSYVWGHTGGAAFGGFFDIQVGEETQLRDLVVQTVKDGEITGTDSRYYFNKKAYEAECDTEQKAIREFQEKNYQSLVMETGEEVQEEESEEGLNFMEALKGAAMFLLKAVPFLLLAAVGIHALYKKYKDNNRTY